MHRANPQFFQSLLHRREEFKPFPQTSSSVTAKPQAGREHQGFQSCLYSSGGCCKAAGLPTAPRCIGRRGGKQRLNTLPGQAHATEMDEKPVGMAAPLCQSGCPSLPVWLPPEHTSPVGAGFAAQHRGMERCCLLATDGPQAGKITFIAFKGAWWHGILLK